MFEDVGFILNFQMGSRFIHDTIIRTFSKKIDALICSMNMLSPDVVLYLYKGTIVLSRKFCIHGWDGTSNSFLNMTNKVLEQLYRTISSKRFASVKTLASYQDRISLFLFNR